MTAVGDGQRVLWHEGMYLLPQQFQQWDRHQARALHRVAASLRPHAVGYSALELDAEALATGRIRLLRCAGILGDGFVFDLPVDGPLPAARELPARERCRVRLSLPEVPADGAAWSADGLCEGRPTRFRRREATMRDSAPEGQEDTIALAEPAFRLLLDDETDTGCVTLPLASLNREGGLWKLEETSPPLLALAAWPPLLALTRSVAEFLADRSAEMRAQRRERGSGLVEFSISEISLVLTTQAINASLPVLADLLAQPALTHPLDLHRELARLAGAVSTFAGHGPEQVPVYDHAQPTLGLRSLFELLRGSFGTAAPTRYVPLRLVPVNDRIGTATLPEGLAGAARFYLAVRTSMPADAVMNAVPAKLKVGAAGRIGALVAKALRGVELAYLAVPPAEIPAAAEHHYFEIRATGAEWDAVMAGNAIAVYTPPDLAELGLELLAVRS